MAVQSDILPPRYRGARRIARGGMGEIFRATDDVLGREVAVKVLAERYASDQGIGARFTREALAAARLSGQPSTVMIFDVGEWCGRPFIVMEYLPGGSLADRLDAEGAQPPARVLQWLEQAAAALDAAHQRGVVHRDVKPANLLLDRDGGVHVADFGIASAAGLDSLTATGMVLGTAGYLSPEQARGEPTTPASDRYALAVTAFELLAGDRPFENDSATSEAAAHVQAAVPSLSARRAELPLEVDDVFERALAKNPAARYPTCGAFSAALREVLSRAATPAEALTTLLAKKATRRVAWLPLALAAVAAVAVGIAVAAVLDRGGGGTTRTVVERVTLPGATITHETTVQATTSSAQPSTAAASPDGHALNDQGYSKLQQGDFAGAVPLLQQAVAALRGAGPADPYEGYANYNLGVALGRLGRCFEAASSIATASRLEPGNNDVRRALKAVERCVAAGSGGGNGGGNHEG